MSKNMASADDKSKGLGKALDILGISARDKNGTMKDAATIYVEMAAEMGKYEDGAGKAGLAMAAMGKSGAEQNKVFAAMAEAQQFVVSATKKQIEAADRYNDNLTKLSLAGGAFAKIIGHEIAPVLADFTDVLLDVATGSNGVKSTLQDLAKDGTLRSWAQQAALWVAEVIDVFDALVRVAQIVWKALATGVEQTIEMFTGIGAAMKKALSGDFAGAVDAAKSSFEKMKASGSQFLTDFDAIASRAQFSSMLKAKFAESDAAMGKTKESSDKLKLSWQDANEKAMKYAEDMAKLTQSIQDANDKLRTEGEAIGKTRLERELANVALEREKAHRQDKLGLQTKNIDRLFDEREAILRNNDATREAEEAQKRLMKAYADATKEAQKEVEASEKLREAFGQQTKSLEQQVTAFGKTTAEMRLYNIEEQRKLALSKAVTAADVEYIEQEYQKQKALAGTITKLEETDAAAKNWQDTLDSINQAGYDLFQSMADGFDGVKDWAKNAGDAIKKWFLSVLYELTAKPFVVSIVASLAGGISGNAVAGNLNGGSSILSMFGLGGEGGLGGIGGLLGGGLAGIGNWIGALGGGAGGFFGGLGGGLTNLAVEGLIGGTIGNLSGGFAALGAGNILGGMGSLLAGALPIAGLAAMVIPLIMDWFDDGPAMRTATFASGPASRGGTPMFASSSQFGEFGIVDDKWFSEADMGQSITQFLEGIKGIDNALAAIIGKDLTAQVKTALEGVATEFEAGIEHEAVTFGAVMKERYVAVFGVLDERLGQVVAGFEGTGEELAKFLVTLADVYMMVQTLPEDVGDTLLDVLSAGVLTVEEIGRFAAAYVGLQQVLAVDPVAEALDAISAASTTNYGRVMQLRGGLEELLESYDGSVDGTERLYAATMDYVKAQIIAIAEIENMKATLSDLFGEARTTIEQFFWTNDQKAAKLIADATKYQELLNNTLDPTLIDKYAKLVQQDLMQAFQLLSPEQQAAQQSSFLQRLEAADKLVQERLEASKNSITQQGTDQKSIMEAIRDALNAAAASMIKAADAMTNAANTQAAAANTQLAAAQTPVTVDTNVTVEVEYQTPAAGP